MQMWKRVELLGRGGFGFVSLAVCSRSQNPDESSLVLPPIVAVKSEKVTRSVSLQAERELLSLFQDCPQIIRCYGAQVTEEDGVILYNMILEFASGGSLSDQIQKSRYGLRAPQVRQITRSILKGLSFIHRKGFVHCDIKPSNVLIVNDQGKFHAKIADFGLADSADRLQRDRKRKRGLRGTLQYIAPESILAGEIGSEADIWALGVTILEMFTAKPLWYFDGNCGTVDCLRSICVSEVKFPCGLCPDAEDFLKRCLNKNPKQRWSADMLLGHPFVSSRDHDEDISDLKIREERRLSSDTNSFIRLDSSKFDDDSHVSETSFFVSDAGLDYIIKPNFVFNPPMGMAC